jgi:acyl carrier protein
MTSEIMMHNETAAALTEPSTLLQWLVQKFAEWLEAEPSSLDPSQPISAYGLDSITAVSLSVSLEDELGVELETALLWDYPTLESLAAHLAGEIARQGAAGLPALSAT